MADCFCLEMNEKDDTFKIKLPNLKGITNVSDFVLFGLFCGFRTENCCAVIMITMIGDIRVFGHQFKK